MLLNLDYRYKLRKVWQIQLSIATIIIQGGWFCLIPYKSYSKVTDSWDYFYTIGDSVTSRKYTQKE